MSLKLSDMVPRPTPDTELWRRLGVPHFSLLKGMEFQEPQIPLLTHKKRWNILRPRRNNDG